jgi:hypothetical protein
MAIIYTYPTKSDPVSADKILISDSEDSNKTKQVSIEDIRGATTAGVSSISAGTNITLDPAGGTGDVEINSLVYTGAAGITVELDQISVDLKADSGLVIDNQEVSINLSASAIAGTLAVSDGGTGAATLTGLVVGNGASAFTDRGDIDDLYTAKFDTAANGSLYIGNIPSSSPSLGLNVVVGNSAGNAMTATSESNTLMGYSAANGVDTGGANVIIGETAGGSLRGGSGNTIIGRRADVSSGTDATSVAIGSNASTTLDGVAVGATSSAARDSVALGREATAGRDGIAIGSGAEAAANELALGSDSHSLTTSTASMSAATKWLKVTINGEVTDYYIPLQTLAP